MSLDFMMNMGIEPVDQYEYDLENPYTDILNSNESRFTKGVQIIGRSFKLAFTSVKNTVLELGFLSAFFVNALSYVVIKLAVVAEAARLAFNIATTVAYLVPAALVGIICKLSGYEEAAANVFARARAVVENNIKISAISFPLTIALTGVAQLAGFVSAPKLLGYVSPVLNAVGIVGGAIASIWRAPLQNWLHAKGLVEDGIGDDLDHDLGPEAAENTRRAELAGTVVGYGAAVGLSATGVIVPSVMAAAGAEGANRLLNMYRARQERLAAEAVNNPDVNQGDLEEDVAAPNQGLQQQGPALVM